MDGDLLEPVDVSPYVEAMLQDSHDAIFEWTPYARQIDPCVTCKDKPLWGCALWPCSETQSCFILCPTCGQYGFGEKPSEWVPDNDLAALLLEKMGR